MLIAVDTNVIGYAEGLDDEERRRRANDVLEVLTGHDFVCPVQVLAELHRLVLRRTRCTAAVAGETVGRWQTLLPANPETTGSVLATAFEVAAAHRLQIFDAIILAASAGAGCRILLSEDMGDGFVWRGTTVVNPFKPDPHPLLADLLRPH